MFVRRPKFNIKESFQQFFTLRGEELLFIKRQHVLLTIMNMAIAVCFGIFLGVCILLWSKFILAIPLSLFLCLYLALALFTISLVAKFFVDWYFHIYIITNRKILEVCYKPLFSKVISTVPLDQVRCLEVNAQTNGIINTLFDIGHLYCHFDMLTHQDTFIMSHIHAPEKFGVKLADTLNTIISSRVPTQIMPLPLDTNQTSPEQKMPVVASFYAFGGI